MKNKQVLAAKEKTAIENKLKETENNLAIARKDLAAVSDNITKWDFKNKDVQSKIEVEVKENLGLKNKIRYKAS